ncbi:hypothetical protein [Microbispora triticiradicis]|nr:hypothetical protein [Microbispora triticiradicis]
MHGVTGMVLVVVLLTSVTFVLLDRSLPAAPTGWMKDIPPRYLAL